MWVDGTKLKKLDIPPQEWIDAWSNDSYMQVWMKERCPSS